MDYLEDLIKRYPVLDECKKDIYSVYNYIADSYVRGGKLLIAGNGGSAADAEHIVGELMKGFKKKRTLSDDFKEELKAVSYQKSPDLLESLQGALPAIALDGHPALTTAFINDRSPLLCFAQQVYGYAKPADSFLAISTSGNSKNIIYAAVTAKALHIPVLGLTGKTGGELAEYTDACIKVPETETFKVQELHLPIYHCLCLMLEEKFFEI